MIHYIFFDDNFGGGIMAQLPRKNNILKFACPHIAKEWHPEKNGQLTSDDVSKWSVKKVWWKCEFGHEWEAFINNRTKRNDGCPFCSGRNASEENCLLNSNPSLALELHPTKNGEVSARMITPRSNKKVWWMCQNDNSHVWEASVGSRSNSTSQSKGCPYCAKKIPTGERNLAVDNPILASEWHPTKNMPLVPENVLPYSNKKVWWKCSTCDYEWKAMINNRNKKEFGRGCPECNVGYQTSFAEQAMVFYLSPIFPDLINNYVIKKSDGHFTVDLFISSLRLAIEYDGEYAHKNKLERDLRKNIILSKDKINLLRIREPNLPLLEDEKFEILYRVDSYSFSSLEKVLEEISTHLLGNYSLTSEQSSMLLDFKNLKIEKDWMLIEEKIKKKRLLASLESTHPYIAKQWHPIKNGNLKPSNYTKNSAKKVWWICEKGHEYQSKITDKAESCLVCTNKIVQQSNSLATTHPEMAKEWHPTLNKPLTVNDIVAGSSRLIWWKCSTCNHEWKTSLAKRRGSKKIKGTGCPSCSNKSVTNQNCLAKTNSRLVGEWHPSKNNGLTPYDVTAGSDKSVWWICESCNFEWMAKVYHRKKTGCPECMYKKIANKKKKSNEQFVEEVKALVGNEYIPQQKYKGATEKIDFLHVVCGSILNTSPSKFLSAGRRCKCSKMKKSQVKN